MDDKEDITLNLPESFKAVLPYLPKDTTLNNLEAALNKAVVGREREINETLSVLSKRKPSPILFTGPAGAGKTMMFRALAEQIAGERKENAARIISDLHDAFGDTQAVSDALDILMGRPTRRQRGEMAAEEVRNGMKASVTCMKPLRFKRVFVSACSF